MTPLTLCLTTGAVIFILGVIQRLDYLRNRRQGKDGRPAREIKDCIIIMNSKSKSPKERFKKLFNKKAKDLKS